MAGEGNENSGERRRHAQQRGEPQDAVEPRGKKPCGGRGNHQQSRDEDHPHGFHADDDGESCQEHLHVVQRPHRQPAGPAKGFIEREHEKSAVTDEQRQQCDAGGDGEHDDVSAGDGGRLAVRSGRARLCCLPGAS